MRRLWLCVPPILGTLGDFAVTAWGQPAEYWAGDFNAALPAVGGGIVRGGGHDELGEETVRLLRSGRAAPLYRHKAALT